MSPEHEARATALIARIERAEREWTAVLEENARLRDENARLRAVTGALMGGDGGRHGH